MKTEPDKQMNTASFALARPSLSRKMQYPNTRNAAFTLIELLVVIGIIGILAGILLPVLNKAKVSSLRTDCRNNLRGIGQAMHMYLNESKSFMPVAAQMPSVDALGLPSIVDVLAPHIDTKKAFCCPADHKGYFKTEGTSYEYHMMLIGRRLDDLAKRRLGNNTFMMNDFEPFHGKAGNPGAMNYLFIDGRVGDLKD